ncbi:hypothetical protein Hdeb2414_s0001g00041621 [Helianthus debilis subsp. tardiflorus]
MMQGGGGRWREFLLVTVFGNCFRWRDLVGGLILLNMVLFESVESV